MALIVGLVLSYIATCAIFALSKKDFLTVVATALLQFGSAFLIDDILVGEMIKEDYIITMVMIVLAICGFVFSGKRKRTLIFTLILPLTYLLYILQRQNFL